MEAVGRWEHRRTKYGDDRAPIRHFKDAHAGIEYIQQYMALLSLDGEARGPVGFVERLASLTVAYGSHEWHPIWVPGFLQRLFG